MGQACLEIALIYRFADNFRMIVGTIMQSWHLPGTGSHLRFQAFVGISFIPTCTCHISLFKKSLHYLENSFKYMF